jgi:hypothetical protein
MQPPVLIRHCYAKPVTNNHHEGVGGHLGVCASPQAAC